MSSAFMSTKDLVSKIAHKVGIERALKIENWLQKHYVHKPGPEILHDQYAQWIKGKCHGCKEEVIFNFKVPPLD